MKNYKVLVVSIKPWMNDGGSKTLMELFKGWNPDNLAMIYTTNEVPTSNMSNHYFQISESELIKSVFKRNIQVGKTIAAEINVVGSGDKLDSIKKFPIPFAWLIRNIIWSNKRWESEKLNVFIEEFKPDILFFPIFPYAHMNWIQSYVQKKAKCKVISYVGDDNYSYLPEWYNPSFLLSRCILRKAIRKVLAHTDYLFVIAPQLKEEYGKIYNGPMEVLTRGVDLNGKQEKGSMVKKRQIQILYTGNLYIGRDKTIAKVAAAVDAFNRRSGNIKYKLDIYSQSQLSPKALKRIKYQNSSEFHGKVSQQQAIILQKEADILLFAEAIDIFNRNRARLSFSTKITDYMAAQKCILAVGYEKICPIRYLKENDIGLVACNESEIYAVLERMACNLELLNDYAQKANKWGQQHHNSELMHSFLIDVCRTVVGGK